MKPKVVKTFKHGDSIVMTIPAPFADALGIGPGDYLQVTLKDGSLFVEKVPLALELK
jgi:AbrB family looped-hinge helix DNA binding protein